MNTQSQNLVTEFSNKLFKILPQIFFIALVSQVSSAFAAPTPEQCRTCGYRSMRTSVDCISTCAAPGPIGAQRSVRTTFEEFLFSRYGLSVNNNVAQTNAGTIKIISDVDAISQSICLAIPASGCSPTMGCVATTGQFVTSPWEQTKLAVAERFRIVKYNNQQIILPVGGSAAAARGFLFELVPGPSSAGVPSEITNTPRQIEYRDPSLFSIALPVENFSLAPTVPPVPGRYDAFVVASDLLFKAPAEPNSSRPLQGDILFDGTSPPYGLEFRLLDVEYLPNGLLLLASDDGAHVSADQGQTWKHIQGGDNKPLASQIVLSIDAIGSDVSLGGPRGFAKISQAALLNLASQTNPNFMGAFTVFTEENLADPVVNTMTFISNALSLIGFSNMAGSVGFANNTVVAGFNNVNLFESIHLNTGSGGIPVPPGGFKASYENKVFTLPNNDTITFVAMQTGLAMRINNGPFQFVVNTNLKPTFSVEESSTPGTFIVASQVTGPVGNQVPAFGYFNALASGAPTANYSPLPVTSPNFSMANVLSLKKFNGRIYAVVR